MSLLHISYITDKLALVGFCFLVLYNLSVLVFSNCSGLAFCSCYNTNIFAPSVIRTRNPSKWYTAVPLLRPLRYCDSNQNVSTPQNIAIVPWRIHLWIRVINCSLICHLQQRATDTPRNINEGYFTCNFKLRKRFGVFGYYESGVCGCNGWKTENAMNTQI